MAPAPEPLTPIERAVFSCFTAKDDVDEIKKNIKPGVYQGSLALSVQYTLTKGEATDAKQSASIFAPGIVAQALIQSGLPKDKFLAALSEAAKTILIDEIPPSPKMAAEMAALIGKFDRIKDAITPRMRRKDRSGATRANISIGRFTSPVHEAMVRI
jgi:hypothetical protein